MALGSPADRPPSESTGSVLVTLRTSRAWRNQWQACQKLSPAAPDAKLVPAAPLLPGADPCEASPGMEGTARDRLQNGPALYRLRRPRLLSVAPAQREPGRILRS
jgi:hypothetical protein